jgi:hypothetical protein
MVMKKVWKWILGIVIGLIVLVVLVSAAFFMRRGFHAVRFEDEHLRTWSQEAPGMMPYGGFGYQMRGPGMMNYGGMGVLGGFLGGLISLGFLALLVLGIIWLVRNLHTPKPVDVSTVTPAIAMNPCKKCGKPVQADWSNCPYCGKKV